MKINNILDQLYQNHKLIKYNDIREGNPRLIPYDELGNYALDGVLTSCQYINGRLYQTYTEKGTHASIIAATRLGKTTSYVIPTVLSFAKQKIKKSMVISDPKGEIYRVTAATLREENYKVKVLNFRDEMHSECWNMLTPIYRKYKQVDDVRKEITTVSDNGITKKRFRGKLYVSRAELYEDLNACREKCLGDVSNEIGKVVMLMIKMGEVKDRYWIDSARMLLKAFIWAMLEDSDLDPSDPKYISEETFSIKTVLNIIGTFSDGGNSSREKYNDRGYFSNRDSSSKALQLAKTCLLDNASSTRQCILSELSSTLEIFWDSAVQSITSCTTIKDSDYDDGPVAIFIVYRDELPLHYDLVSMFVRNVYIHLIAKSDASPKGALDVPFYFILDEFGNFPEITGFNATISACAGRNIYFILILQSYAQLRSIYGNDTSQVTIDNLNMHVFFGSNNMDTLKAISEECGDVERLSPSCISMSNGPHIENYATEKLPLVSVNRLSHFDEGEAIVRQANMSDVLLTKLERYYNCGEFNSLPVSDLADYYSGVDPYSKKYRYRFVYENDF